MKLRTTNMAGTKRSGSPAPVAGSKRRASSGQGLISDAFGAKGAAAMGGSDARVEGGSSGAKKGKGRKSAVARQLTPDDSDQEDDVDRAERTPEPSTPAKPRAAAVDPTTAYPTPSKTPAKKGSKAAELKEAAKEVGVIRLDEDDEPAVRAIQQTQAADKKSKVVILEKEDGAIKQPEKLKIKDKSWNKAHADAREKMGGKDPSASFRSWSSFPSLTVRFVSLRSPWRGPKPH